MLRRRRCSPCSIDWGYRPDGDPGPPVRRLDDAAGRARRRSPRRPAARSCRRDPALRRRPFHVDLRDRRSWSPSVDARRRPARDPGRSPTPSRRRSRAAPEQWYSFKPMWPATDEEAAELEARAPDARRAAAERRPRPRTRARRAGAPPRRAGDRRRSWRVVTAPGRGRPPHRRGTAGRGPRRAAALRRGSPAGCPSGRCSRVADLAGRALVPPRARPARAPGAARTSPRVAADLAAPDRARPRPAPRPRDPGRSSGSSGAPSATPPATTSRSSRGAEPRPGVLDGGSSSRRRTRSTRRSPAGRRSSSACTSAPIELPALYLAQRSGRHVVGADGDPRRPGRCRRWFGETRAAARRPDRRPGEARARAAPAALRTRRVGRARRRPRHHRRRHRGRRSSARRRRSRSGPALLALETGAPSTPASASGGCRDGRYARPPRRASRSPAEGTRRERIDGDAGGRSRPRSRRSSPTRPSSGGRCFFPIWPDLVRATADGRRRRRPGRDRATADDRPARPRRPPHPHPRLRRHRGSPTILDHVERDRPRRHRDHRPRADRRRASPRRTSPATAACASRSSSARRSRRSAATCSACSSSERVRPCERCARRSRADPRPGRDRDPGPSARAVSAVRPGLGAAPAPRRRRPARPPRRDRGVQPDGARPAVARAGRPLRRGARPARGRQQRRPRRATRSASAGPPSRAGRRRTCGRRSWPATTHHHGTFHGTAGQLGVVRAAAAEVRPRRAGRSAAGSGATARAATSAIPGGRAGRRGSTRRGGRGAADGENRPMKIGLVTPYVYPLPGGVTQHVRYLYENLRLRGHDVRIITTSPRPPARLRGRRHPDRQGLLDAGQRLGRDDHRLAAVRLPGPRHARARAVRPAPLPRAVRAVPVAGHPAASRRASTSATFHAYGGFSPSYEFGSRAMRGVRRRGSTAGSRSAARRGTSSTATSRATTRSSPTASTSTASSAPSRSRAGRTARSNILFVGRFEPRKGLLDLLKAYRILRKTGCDCRLLRRRRRPAGTRGAALRRDAPAAAASSSSAASATTRRPSCSGPPTSTCSPATGRESFGIVLLEAMAAGTADRRHRHPRLQGRRPARPRGAARAAARAEGARRAPSPGSSRDRRAARRRWARAGRARAEEFSWERVTAKVDDYYGFVIRRLAAAGPAAAGLPRADPAVAARRGDAASTGPTPADVAGVAAGRPALGRPACRPAAAPPAPRRLVARLPLGERDPPDPGRVGDDDAQATTSTTSRIAEPASASDGRTPRGRVLTGNWNGYR